MEFGRKCVGKSFLACGGLAFHFLNFLAVSLRFRLLTDQFLSLLWLGGWRAGSRLAVDRMAAALRSRERERTLFEIPFDTVRMEQVMEPGCGAGMRV